MSLVCAPLPTTAAHSTDRHADSPQQTLTELGTSIIIEENNGDRSTFVRLRAGGTARMGKGCVPATQLVGVPFGALFELSGDGKTLQRLGSRPSDGSSGVKETDRNNSKLVDDNANQKLSQADIEMLKQSGTSGADIVSALCSNSASYQNKTEFAQEKYKKKKVKKYCTYVVVREPTARAMCQVYFDKGPERMYNLRPDSLGIMLSLGNVGAGAQVLVIESCIGVVTAAVVERLGGYGRVCACGLEASPPMAAVDLLNLSPAQRAAVSSAPLADLLHAQQMANGSATHGVPGSGDEQQVNGLMDAASIETIGKDIAEPKQTQKGYNASTEQLHQLGATGFNSCLLASPRHQPTALLQAVWPLLAPSASFVVYSNVMQPLAEAMNSLQVNRQAVMLQVQESWFRPHQVLPARTHPMMMCSGTGGYLLSGTKVLSQLSKVVVDNSCKAPVSPAVAHPAPSLEPSAESAATQAVSAAPAFKPQAEQNGSAATVGLKRASEETILDEESKRRKADSDVGDAVAQ